jgi:acyl-coenzyme A thioesterase PaaI-like protein
LTAEFKINLLRPASGQKLRCVSRVLKPGRNLVVAESEVFSDSDDSAVLSAKAMVTLAVISKSWTPDA